MICSSANRLYRMGAPGRCSTQEPTHTLDQLPGTGSVLLKGKAMSRGRGPYARQGRGSA